LRIVIYCLYGEGEMKGRRRLAIIFLSAIGILFGSVCGYSKNAVPAKTNTRNKRAGQSTKQAAGKAQSSVYVVRRGDNLSRVARNHGTTAEALKTANKLKGNVIQVGQKLRIPGKGKSPDMVARSEEKNSPPIPQMNAIPPELAAKFADSGEDDPSAQPLRFRLVKAGFEMLGVRYRRSGGSEESGFDCSGLVKSLFSKFDIDLPRSSREQFLQGEKVERDKLEAGDLVFFSSGGKRPTHVGIYVGDNKFIHAALKARQVIVSDLNKIWYTMRYLGARRVLEDEPAPEPQEN
jgi:peptidoglycan DL-endopeptidase LytE